MERQSKHYLICSENDSDPETISGNSFCHCVEQVFAAMKTDKGWDEYPLPVLQCLAEIASDDQFDGCPGPGESIRIVATATNCCMDTVRMEYIYEESSDE
jgi:hypothetical protein